MLVFAGLRGPDLRFPPTKPAVPRQARLVVCFSFLAQLILGEIEKCYYCTISPWRAMRVSNFSKFRPCAWNAWALSARASRHACMALRARQLCKCSIDLRCCLTASGERADNRFDNTSPNQVLTNPARGCFAADARKGLWSEQLFNHLQYLCAASEEL